MGNCNIHSHSKALKIRVDFVNIHNLDRLTIDFKKQFERRTGKGSVKDILIQKYKANGGIIHQIDIIAMFQTSLSYGYLNDIEFPTNWTFFEHTNQRSKYPVRNGRSSAMRDK